MAVVPAVGQAIGQCSTATAVGRVLSACDHGLPARRWLRPVKSPPKLDLR